MYKLSWKKAKTMGYVRAKPKGIAKSLIQDAEDPFSHAGDYAGGNTGEKPRKLIFKNHLAKLLSNTLQKEQSLSSILV